MTAKLVVHRVLDNGLMQEVAQLGDTASLFVRGDFAQTLFDGELPAAPVTSTPAPGAPGESAYQLAVDAGFVGTVTEWLAMLKGVPGDPGAPATGGSGTVININITGGNLPRPANQAELQSMAMAVAAGSLRHLWIDPATPPITLSSTLTLPLVDRDDLGMGYTLSRVPLVWAGSDGVTPAVQIIGAGKHIAVRDILVMGNAFASAGCGNGIEVVSQGGDIWLANFRGLTVSWCGKDGVVFRGNVYESTVAELDCKDNGGFGAACETPNGGVISNLRFISPDLSRNRQQGIQLRNGVSSVDMVLGSFINNGAGGIDADNGMRTIAFVNGENTGQILVNMPGSAFPSLALGNSLSSSGIGANPSTYLIKCPPANLIQQDNTVTPYQAPGGPTPPTMAVVAP